MTATAWSRAAERSRAAVQRVRDATRAEGAGESGLASLIELNAANSAGDALVAVALAGTLFFSVPTDQARGRVALYLAITLAPFSVIAPVIAPVLDRFRSGRRYTLAATLAARAVVGFLMASAIAHHHAALGLYPGAFAMLILSRAYGVSRSAVLPRLLPKDATLVRSNARVSLAGTVAGLAVGTFGALVVATAGPKWALRLAGLVFLGGALLALRLPRHADSREGELRLPLVPHRHGPHPQAQVGDASERAWWAETPHPPPVVTEPIPDAAATTTAPDERRLGKQVTTALRANAALRAYSGFLTVFVAFMVRTTDLGPSSNIALGLLAIAAGAGGVLGQGLGARLHGRAPQALILFALASSTTLAFVAFGFFGLGALMLLTLGAGAGQAVAKLSLDSVIQQQVPEDTRTAAFARSETVLQLSFVAGGAVGLIPIDARFGLMFAAIGLAVVMLDQLRRRRRLRKHP